MSNTHTSGPWMVEPCPDGLDIYSPKGRIAMINLDEPEEGNDLLPNARLIAAAPELLAALEELMEGACEALSFLDREIVKHIKPLIDTAETAISKARGEE